MAILIDRAKCIAVQEAEAANSAGLALTNVGRHEEALACYEHAVTLFPQFAQAHNNKGNALDELGRKQEAVGAYLRATEIDPNYASAFFNLGLTLEGIGLPEQAFGFHIRARRLGFEISRLAPRLRELSQSLAHIIPFRHKFCNWLDFDEIAPLDPLLFTPSDPWLLMHRSTSAKEQRNFAEAVSRTKFPQSKSYLPPAPSDGFQDRRLRVGFLSEAMRNHPLTHLTVGVFEKINRERLECHGIALSSAAEGDMWRSRIAGSFEFFHDFHSLTDTQISDRLRELSLDIVIDLDGHTELCRSLNILCDRVSPIQMTWLGYPGTIGAPFIDYILADHFIIPFGHEDGYSEKIARMPHCYQPNDGARAVPLPPDRKELGLPKDQFVFGCLNTSYKIMPYIFDIWMRALQAVPGSVLWLIFTSDEQVTNLRHEAQIRNVDPDRLIFAPRVNVGDHIARLGAADLYIDTFPCGAHTSAAEALWAGLPIVTLVGETFASRVAGSLLTTIGLSELIADTPGAYETLIIDLATQRDRLRIFREKLWERRSTAPLFDAERFAKDFERVLVEIYHEYTSSL